MFIEDLAKAVIEVTDGRDAAKQFLDSYQSGNFVKQDPMALKAIKYTLSELLDSDLLADSENGELVDYFAELSNYLKTI